MTNEQNEETQAAPDHVSIEDLTAYLLIGLDKDGNPIIVASQNMTMPDMGMLLGRAITDFVLQLSSAGAYQAMGAYSARVHAPKSNIVIPR